ncbi:hypothetical protein D3C81_2110330 [compost metagenome]
MALDDDLAGFPLFFIATITHALGKGSGPFDAAAQIVVGIIQIVHEFAEFANSMDYVRVLMYAVHGDDVWRHHRIGLE